MADAQEKRFQPFVPDSTVMAEFTAKAIVLGSIFGLIFGAATVYLALTAGLIGIMGFGALLALIALGLGATAVEFRRPLVT